jgi:hypothetical protein
LSKYENKAIVVDVLCPIMEEKNLRVKWYHFTSVFSASSKKSVNYKNGSSASSISERRKLILAVKPLTLFGMLL